MATKRDNPRHHKALARGIRQWRESHALEVLDCANLLEITERHMQLLESGQRRPSVDLLMRMANATRRGCRCAMGFQFCPQGCIASPGGLSAPGFAGA